MPDTTYNGWTNYATWRVNLEIFDGVDPESFTGQAGAPVTGEMLQESAEALLEVDCREGLALDYALAFLHPVNWQEIADHINAANDLTPEEED